MEEIEIKINIQIEGNKISVSNSLPIHGNAQSILNALEVTHKYIFGMLKKVKKSERGNATLDDLYRISNTDLTVTK